MPKKTKRAKLLADARRQKHQHPQPAAPYEPSGPAEKTSAASGSVYVFRENRTPRIKKQAPSITVLPEDEAEFTAIRRDLVKTVIMAAVAFILEIGLYWRFGKM